MSVTGYARANAAIRAMVSRLLSVEERRRLITAPSLPDAVRQLETGPYAADMAALAGQRGVLLPIEKALEHNLVSAYDRVIHLLSGGPRAMVEALLRRLEVENLKAILRGLVTNAKREDIERVLLPLDGYSRLPVAELLTASTLAEAIDVLGELPYARLLHQVAERFEHERSLFPIEVALDLGYHRHLWAAVTNLTGRDREIAGRIIGTRFDATNVAWTLRYKVIYHLSAEEIFNYTLPYGYHINDRIIRRMGAAPDLAGVIAALPEPYRGLLQPLAEEGIWLIEVVLNRYLWREARNALSGYPFQIGTVLGYLYLKEAESHDIKAILEGKRYERSPGEIETFLWGEA